MIALTNDEIVDVTVAPSPQIARRITVGQRFSATYSGGRIYSAGPTGVRLGPPSRVFARVSSGCLAIMPSTTTGAPRPHHRL